MAEKQITLTETEANTFLMLLRIAQHAIPPADPNYDGIQDACVLLRNKVNAGEPVKAKAKNARPL